MAGAITSPDLAIAASKVVRASQLLAENITNPAGYVFSVSPADVAACLTQVPFLTREKPVGGRPTLVIPSSGLLTGAQLASFDRLGAQDPQGAPASGE